MDLYKIYFLNLQYKLTQFFEKYNMKFLNKRKNVKLEFF